MPRPILLGIVGDSAAGKTTLTRGLVRILGDAQVTHVSADHYRRNDREPRAQRGLTPLNQNCNHSTCSRAKAMYCSLAAA